MSKIYIFYKPITILLVTISFLLLCIHQEIEMTVVVLEDKRIGKYYIEQFYLYKNSINNTNLVILIQYLVNQ